MPVRAIPPWSVPLFFVVGAVSQYVGAAIGVWLFATTEPATVAWLRAMGAAVVLLAWRRPWNGRERRPWTRRGVGAAAAFGAVTLAMNIAFYESIARIPLGTAVAIEFTGPVAVAVLGSRRPLDYAAVGLVGAGVYLLAGVQADVDAVGVAFALLAAALWAGYIVLGKRVADAVHAQPDMHLVGVADIVTDWRIQSAVPRLPVFAATPDAHSGMVDTGIRPEGTLDDLLAQSDVIVDTTPKHVAAGNLPRYQAAGVKVIVQGGEAHSTTGHSFVAQANYATALGRDLTRVVSCNTTSIVRVLGALENAGLLLRARGVIKE